MLKSFVRTGVWAVTVVLALTSPVAAQEPKKSVEVERLHIFIEVVNVPRAGDRHDIIATPENPPKRDLRRGRPV